MGWEKWTGSCPRRALGTISQSESLAREPLTSAEHRTTTIAVTLVMSLGGRLPGRPPEGRCLSGGGSRVAGKTGQLWERFGR